MSHNESGKQKEIRYFRRMLRAFFMLLLMMAVMFILAGRLTYWQTWVYGGTSVVFLLIASVMFVDKTDLIKERIKPGPGTKWWDKIFFALYIPLFIILFTIAGLDAGRFGWTPRLPVSAYIIGYMAYVFSNALIFWAMSTNRFFSSRVRIQTDRGHEVVQEGPYRFVRHPGYVGAIPLTVSISLVLGSLWALIPATVIIVLLIIRTHLEDNTLQRELPGYADYVKKVRY
ncbi:MAG: isoprenylcysteine carboxylmethyltransferase family protein, partial [Candidatus Hydrogenedentota bacterium]